MAKGKTSTSDPKTAPVASLDSLRGRIDEIDDELHDLLMRRAELVEEIASLKRSDKVAPLRPGREAQILRRLVSRHRGRFPAACLVRVWRDILGGTLAMQTDFSVAVCNGCQDLARDHFGGRAPMIGFSSADEVIGAVVEGSATVGVLPLPEEGEPEPWWLRMANGNTAQARVIARLPFGALGNAAGACDDAFVIANMEPEASGDDCTLLVVATDAGLSTATLTNAFLDARIGMEPLAACAGGGAHLVEAEALLARDDRRLARALAALGPHVRCASLGAYAKPLPDAVLGGIAPK